MNAELIIQPPGSRWCELIAQKPAGILFDHSQQAWRDKTRSELGLSTDRPIIATGHQTMLWHPGILAKYFAVEAHAIRHNWARANLIVDQHAGDFGEFDVPIRRGEGRLGVRTIHLTQTRKDVPMGSHQSFTPPKPPVWPPPPVVNHAASAAVKTGTERIFHAVYAHRTAPNAALQMSGALGDLMSKWVAPMPAVTATELMHTTLSRSILKQMAEDPHRCAKCYNEAVRDVPEAGIPPLLIRDDYVELPLWRAREDGRRIRGYDNDVQTWLDSPHESPQVLPRALLMTALLRLGMCDLFIHGTGGARYDRAMELWIKRWLGVEVSPIAVVSATLRLPLNNPDDESIDLQTARKAYRQLWHDPPGVDKNSLLEKINKAPHGSTQRQACFFALHKQLEEHRHKHEDDIDQARHQLDKALQQQTELPIINRRTWAFPLYPESMLDELFQGVAATVDYVPSGCCA